MNIPIYQVDAFTDKVFSGNPAAVCPLEKWIPDDLLQKIASENNLSETAFFVRENDVFRIRWFTPKVEVDLCGHATLASGYVLFNHLNWPDEYIHFESRSGRLNVRKDKNLITLDFPASDYREVPVPEILVKALGKKITAVYQSVDYLVVFNTENEILDIRPDFQLLYQLETRGVVVTSRGKNVDFVSRFFAPGVGINEDPVTGSSHTLLTPFWADKLGKKELTARQLSERGGTLYCKYSGNRVEISGQAVTFLEGILTVDHF